MERKPLSTGSIVGAVVLLVVVLLGLYVGGYFALSKTWDNYSTISREYASDWLVIGYRPLVDVEAAMTGKKVQASGPTIAYGPDGEDLVNVGADNWVKK